MSYRVLLADDHAVVREGIHALLGMLSGMEVVAEAENGAQAVELCAEHHPDIVLMDIGMPVLNGIEAARLISAEHASIKVIVLSMHSDRRFVTEAFSAGVSAYVLKDAAFGELGHAIAAVTAGDTYLSPAIREADDSGNVLISRTNAAASPL